MADVSGRDAAAMVLEPSLFGIVSYADFSAADTIHRLSLAHQNTALTNLRLRYESLAAITTELPSNISTPPAVDPLKLPDQVSSILVSPSPPSDITPTSPTPEVQQAPIDTSALMLAVFGWQAEPSTIAGLASCAACFRRLGLWLFKPSSHPSSPRSPSSSPPPMARLDVVAEHREYCPWINASSQGGGGSSTGSHISTANLAGWELLLRAINNAQQSRRDAAGLPLLSDERRADSAVDDVPFGANEDTSSLRSEAVTAADMHAKELAARDEKDKERWAKLKRLKQVFHVKRGKGNLGSLRRSLTKGKENHAPGA